MRAAPWTFVLVSILVACGGEAKEGGEVEAGDEAKTEAKAGGSLDAFSAYQAKSMAAEAKVNVGVITRGVKMAFEEELFDPATMTATTGRLLAAPMTPPAGSCCKQPGGTCRPDMGDWSHEGWKAAMFQLSEPHRYSYEIAVDGQTVTVRAVGDLDCDGELATYEAVGTIKDGALEFSPEVHETAPLE
ncbi:hypothetical protein [Paraliomyxa miuraensis]|uniref:hypothetical protein n=1 Tax=Paraliomyxa miuraensis TaxID=376150 RepID=UPI0022520DE0|nr:hypothetical protein [Paraliomyxa miuraensis]MCX4244070.1 hypothetical protein [Paraliomyxa miuraensis]